MTPVSFKRTPRSFFRNRKKVKVMRRILRKIGLPLLAVWLTVSFQIPLSGAETLCFTQRVTDAPSFNIYTGRNDANNPIIWSHQVPEGILNSVVRVGLYIEAFDVDYPAATEHDRVYFNGYDLGLLEGFDDTWMTVEKTVPVAALKSGLNELRVKVDELRTNWKVTIRASELRFYCASPDPDFSLGLSGDTLTVAAGQSDSLTVALTGLNNFSSPVALSVSGLPAGASAQFSPNPATPNPSAASAMQINTALTSPPGQYTVTVTGENGAIRHTASFTLIISGVVPEEPDYAITVEPLEQTVSVGQSVQYEIKISTANGFNKDISLDINNVPAGCTAAFAPRQLKPGASAILTLKTAVDMIPGVYTPKIYSWGGNVHHEAVITLKVLPQTPDPDFILRVAPSSRVVERGGETWYALTIESINGFNGTTQLSVGPLPAGVDSELDSSSLSPSGSVKWRIRAGEQTAPGSYSLTVNAVSGVLSHSAVVTLAVTCPGFSVAIQAQPISGPAPLTAALNARISAVHSYPAGDYRYQWDFGDGGSSAEIAPVHTWQKPGKYTVMLKITDPCGAVANASAVVEAEGFEGAISTAFSVPEAMPGQEVEILIHAQNATRTDFNDVQISALLPEALEYRGETAPVPSLRNGALMEWRIPVLKKKEMLEIRIRAAVRLDALSAAPGGVVSVAAALRHGSLPAPLNSKNAILKLRRPEITLEKQVNRETAQPGDTLVYIITARNFSDAVVENAVIRDEWPENLEYLSQQSALAFKQEKGELVWNGVLAAQQTVKIEIRARISAMTPAGKTIRNRARLEAPLLPQAIHSGHADTIVQSQPISEGAILFDKRTETPQADVGRIVRFNITLINRSSGLLIAPVIEDHLPQGFAYVEHSTLLGHSPGPEPQGKRVLKWLLPHLEPGGSVVLRYQTVIGADARRGKNTNRAILMASDNTGKTIRLESSAFINVSSGGFVFYSTLDGTVYLDRDRDNFFSGGDEPLEGIEVMMSNGSKAMTDRNGQYRFENLFAGEYAVAVNRVALPERFRSADTVPQVVSLSDGLSDTADLGLRFSQEDEVSFLRLEGRVFFDKNGNKQFDPGSDPLVENFRVQIDELANTIGNKGKFVFSRLKPGSHTIKIYYGPKMHRQEVNFPAGNHQADIPLRFSGIKIVIRGEQ